MSSIYNQLKLYYVDGLFVHNIPSAEFLGRRL